MLVDPSNTAAGSAVTGAIRQASQSTGTSFGYLVTTAQVESGFNAIAGAATSSARGLFQFIQQTWLATLKQAGPALGYGRYAAAISQNASGQYEVSNAALRSEILGLRNDPTANAVMAGAFTKANATVLSERLGRSPSEGELYIAHFLGAGGAARLINLAAANPNAKAADFFSEAAHANSPIFYDRTTGAARSVAQVRNILTARYDAARGRQSHFIETAQAVTAPTAVAAPDTAGIAGAFATAAATPANGSPATPNAETASVTLASAASTPTATAPAKPPRAAPDNQVFHSLFVDGDRAAPLGSAVAALWSAPLAAAGSTRAQQPGGSLLDLFRDSAKDS